MPEIYPPEVIAKRTYPSIEALTQAAGVVQDAVSQMHKRGDVVSASSLGSLYDADKTPVIGSDIDWMIIFADLQAMLGSAELKQMLQELTQKKVPFHNPVLSLDSIANNNFMIAPILHGMRRSTKRIITGEDPVNIFEQHGIKKNDHEMISRIFASYTRYFFEEVATALHEISGNKEVLAGLLEKALNFYRETYRSMIVASLDEDDYSKSLTFEVYQELYADTIKADSMSSGTDVETFLADYNALLQTLDASVDAEAERRQQYEQFLSDRAGVVQSSALFSQANIQHFRSTIRK